MAKFEIGDKVKVVKENDIRDVGYEYIINRIGTNFEEKTIYLEEDKCCGLTEDYIEIVEKANKWTRKRCLEMAKEIVCKDRENTYGKPEDNFQAIATLWSGYLETDIFPGDVAMMMALLKIARIKGGKYKADNFIDLAGYAACACEIGDKE